MKNQEGGEGERGWGRGGLLTTFVDIFVFNLDFPPTSSAYNDMLFENNNNNKKNQFTFLDIGQILCLWIK